MTTKSLDLGCGLQPKNPFNAQEVYGIDVRDDAEAHIVKADLVIEPIPFPDDSFDYVTAHDFLEHVPRLIYLPQRRNAFVEVMNEIHRVLKPGGVFVGYDLTRTPVATAVHRVDRSPFRLVNPDELAAEGRRHGLQVDTATKMFGHVMQFSAISGSADRP